MKVGNWFNYYEKKERTWYHAASIGKKIACVKSGGIKMGKWCFPNKKILRNSPCLPACKQKNIATRLRDTT